MAIPQYYKFYTPLLNALSDGKPHLTKELKQIVAKTMQLSDADLSEYLPSGSVTVFANRFGWATTYMKKAGLIVTPKKYYLQLTSEGHKILQSGLAVTNDLMANRYPVFADFIKRKNSSHSPASIAIAAVAQTETEQSETPQETFERVYKIINEQLSDDLLTEIMNQTPSFFERLVVDLMRLMDYGDGFVTKQSGDDGIDGIIHEDKLGFNLIYIQAKRWNPSIKIGRPDIQKFAGAMMGPPKIDKGLFITTATFSQGARDYAKAQHIILVDGRKLTELMIEYGLGVSTLKAYKLKKVDGDYFSDN